MSKFHGDASQIMLVGQSAGGMGAYEFATLRPRLWSAVGIICAPWVWQRAVRTGVKGLEGLPIWVVGWAGDGRQGNDDFVTALKMQRRLGLNITRYTRYIKAPGPPDPLYSSMLNHASYDLILRDPRFWDWMLHQHNTRLVREPIQPN